MAPCSTCPAQQSLGEAALPWTLSTNVIGDGAAGRLDYTGAFGTYYQEVFHHIPELLATHLNGQQQFAAAQQWLHYLFDPTAAESIGGAAGATDPANPPWRDAAGVGIYCDVDTSSAGLRETPVYLTSIGGTTNHWELTGAAAICNPTPTSFRIYLQRPGGNPPTVQEANKALWTVQWVAVPRGRRCGTTIPGHTNWQDDPNGAGIYCDVDTSLGRALRHPRLHPTDGPPVDLPHLARRHDRHHRGRDQRVRLADRDQRRCSPTQAGFRIHLRRPGPLGQPTAEEANNHRLGRAMVALPVGPAVGRIEPGATNWQAGLGWGVPGPGVYCEVDTSAAGLSKTPLYLASISGEYTDRHWELTLTHRPQPHRPGFGSTCGARAALSQRRRKRTLRSGPCSGRPASTSWTRSSSGAARPAVALPAVPRAGHPEAARDAHRRRGDRGLREGGPVQPARDRPAARERLPEVARHAVRRQPAGLGGRSLAVHDEESVDEATMALRDRRKHPG